MLIRLENVSFALFQKIGGGKQDVVALIGGKPRQFARGPARGLHLRCNGVRFLDSAALDIRILR